MQGVHCPPSGRGSDGCWMNRLFVAQTAVLIGTVLGMIEVLR